MLRTLQIRRFRSLYEVDLDLGRINLFIGANGAGKSNVLEAIGVLSAALARGLDDRTLAERGVRRSVPTLFKSSFEGQRLSNTFSLAADLEGEVHYALSVRASDAALGLEIQTEDLRIGARRVFGRGPRGARLYSPRPRAPEHTPADPARGLWDTHKALLDVPPAAAEGLRALGQYGLFAPETGVMRGTSVEHFPRAPLGLGGSGLAGAFAAAMKQRRTSPDTAGLVDKLLHLSGWTSGISLRRRDESIVPRHVTTPDPAVDLVFRDRFMHPRRNLLSAYDASEGTLYLLFIAVLLAHPDTPPIFSLDNVDSTLNPAVVQRVLQHLSAAVSARGEGGLLPRQVFLTTHHPSALDGLDLFNPEHRVFVVWRAPQTGQTQITRLQPPRGVTREDWILERHGARLSTLLLEGHLPHALTEI